MDQLRRFFVLIIAILALFAADRAQAQSDVRTPDQKIIFPQMDPVLVGMWDGHGGQEGMRFDPQAIACMVGACSSLRSAFPNDIQRWRDSRAQVFQGCYAAHLQRARQAGYSRMKDPPPLTSLVCSVIESQRQSRIDAVYAAVNGHPRPAPTPHAAIATTTNGPTRIRLDPAESQRLVAELMGLAGNRKAGGGIRGGAKAKQPSSYSAPDHGQGKRGGLSGFEILSINEHEAVLRILPGASYYTVERSFLANDFETDSLTVMTYRRDGLAGSGNDRAQIFFPFHLKNGKIELYRPRLQLKPNDIKGRLGSIDAATSAFMKGCRDGSCESRFALQAGEILRLPRKGTVQASPHPTTSNQKSADDRKDAVAPVGPKMTDPAPIAATAIGSAPEQPSSAPSGMALDDAPRGHADAQPATVGLTAHRTWLDSDALFYTVLGLFICALVGATAVSIAKKRQMGAPGQTIATSYSATRKAAAPPVPAKQPEGKAKPCPIGDTDCQAEASGSSHENTSPGESGIQTVAKAAHLPPESKVEEVKPLGGPDPPVSVYPQLKVWSGPQGLSLTLPPAAPFFQSNFIAPIPLAYMAMPQPAPEVEPPQSGEPNQDDTPEATDDLPPMASGDGRGG